MMKKTYIYSGEKISKGAKVLSREMRVLRLRKPSRSKFVPTRRKTVVNWGASQMPENYQRKLKHIVNHPACLSVAINKREFFECMDQHGVNIPEWTTSRAEAQEWLDNGIKVMARTLLTAHSGRGIIVCTEGAVPPAPLYVKYVKKKDEYRVHYIKGSDEDFVQRKARVRGIDNPNWDVRNLGGGFIYANDPANVGIIPLEVRLQSKLAFEASGLDFGAVDVLWNQHYGKAYVLEMNTAPGLVGKTVDFYSKGLKEHINAMQYL